MRFEVRDPRADPAPAGWAAFAQAARVHPVWSYDVMALEAWGARNPQLLVVACEGDELVAAMSVLVCRPRLAPRFAPRPGKRLLRPFWAEVYQPWLSGYPGVVFAPGFRDRAALLRAFERQAARLLGPGLIAVVYRAIGEDLAGGLEGRGRLVKRVDPVAVLENRFESEEDWFATLSKSRRAALRRQRRRLAEDPTLVVRGGPARTDLDGAELARLIREHRERYGRLALDTRTMPSSTFLDRFVRRPDVHTLTYCGTDGRLLAVQTLLDHPDAPVLQHWAALPPGAGGKRWLYFDSYVRAVRFTAQRGAIELSAGRGMIELKEDLGFRARPLYTAAVPRPVLGR